MIGKYAGKLKRFILRAMIYCVVLLWSFTKLNNVEKNNTEFKNKMVAGLGYWGIQNKDIAEFLEDPITLLVYSFFEVVAGIFGVFGSYYGHLFSAIFFFITNFIYYNPFLPVYHISLFETRPEMFYNIGILLSILLLLYYPQEQTKNINQVKQSYNSDEDEDLEENEKVTSKSQIIEKTKSTSSKKKKN
jgi:hypothetical protein